MSPKELSENYEIIQDVYFLRYNLVQVIANVFPLAVLKCLLLPGTIFSQHGKNKLVCYSSKKTAHLANGLDSLTDNSTFTN